MQTRQLNTLDAGIRATLAKLGDSDARYYFRLLPHAYDFWKDYVADSGRENRTVELAILPDRTAVLPDDYTNYVMVGIKQSQYVRNLVYNEALTSIPDGGERYMPIDPNLPPLAHEYVGWGGGRLYGYGYPGYRGEFKIDSQNRRIVCSTEIPGDGTLVLHYYALAPDTNEGWVIDPLWEQELHLYLSWQFYVYVKKDMQQAMYFKQEYQQAKKRTARRTSTFSLAGAAAIMGKAARSFPK